MLFSKFNLSLISLVTLSLSFFASNAKADLCEEQKILAKVEYDRMAKEFFNQGLIARDRSFYSSFNTSSIFRSSSSAALMLIKSVSDAKDRFYSMLTGPEKELLEINSKKALSWPSIQKKLNDSFYTQYNFERLDTLTVYDNDRALLCHRYSVLNIHNNNYCLVLGLPDFTIMTVAKNQDEMIKRVTFLSKKMQKELPKSDIGGVFNLEESEEAFIKRVSAEACSGGVNQVARSEVKTNAPIEGQVDLAKERSTQQQAK